MKKILPKIAEPKDLRKLKKNELQQVVDELRSFIIGLTCKKFLFPRFNL